MIANDNVISPINSFETISFNDFPVSWVGQVGSFVCYGSEDGRLKFLDRSDTILAETDRSATDSEEAINGVARVGNCLAVSTRCDVSLVWNLSSDGEKTSASIQTGSHGVIASPGGNFIAPSGKLGLIIVSPVEDRVNNCLVTQQLDNPLYFYRSIALPEKENRDLIVSATRRRGIAAGILSHDFSSHSVISITPYPNTAIDIIDVCSLGRDHAVAGLSRDGSLLLFTDILTDQDPITLNYPIITGVAYRLLSANGHLFVLTSTGLFVLADLAKRFLQSEPVQGELTHILPVPMTAIDMNICQKTDIHIVTDAGEVLRASLDTLLMNAPKDYPNEAIPNNQNYTRSTQLQALQPV